MCKGCGIVQSCNTPLLGFVNHLPRSSFGPRLCACEKPERVGNNLPEGNDTGKQYHGWDPKSGASRSRIPFRHPLHSSSHRDEVPLESFCCTLFRLATSIRLSAPRSVWIELTLLSVALATHTKDCIVRGYCTDYCKWRLSSAREQKINRNGKRRMGVGLKLTTLSWR